MLNRETANWRKREGKGEHFMSDQQPNRDPASLGCGTLIIIALIVMFFSGGRDTKEMRTQLEAMNQKLDRLEKKVDELAAKVTQEPAEQR
jgi:hypothetical protein